MTIQEKLEQEFSAAIQSVLGDVADQEFEDNIRNADIDEIARKVKFYLDM